MRFLWGIPYAALCIFLAPSAWADPAPGSACTTAGQSMHTGGPDNGSVGGWLICQGGQWRSVLYFNASGQITTLGNQACGPGEFLQYNGTIWACGTAGGSLPALTSANIWVGNGANVATAVAMSGDAMISNTGALTIANNAVDTVMINASAVTNAKLANMIANTIKGNNTGAAAAPTDITMAGLRTMLGPTGTPSATTFLRGDGQWIAPAASLPALNSAQIWVGNASNVATAVTMSGEATLSNAGALTIANNAVTNAKMADNAVGIAELSATGTAAVATFLRGDNTWNNTLIGVPGTPTLRLNGWPASNPHLDFVSWAVMAADNGFVFQMDSDNNETTNNFQIRKNGTHTGNGTTVLSVNEDGNLQHNGNLQTNGSVEIQGTRLNLIHASARIGIHTDTPLHPIHDVTSGARLNAAGSWLDASDRKFKKDIVPLRYGLREVLALQPKHYAMKADNLAQVGFIAQDVMEVMPELVGVPAGENDNYVLSYGQMTAPIVNAIKELSEKVDAQQAEIDALRREGAAGGR